jgi:hypothetical protein
MKRNTLRMGVGVVAACAALAAGISALVVGNDGATAANAPTPSIGPVSSSQPGGLDAATLAGVQALNREGVGAALLGQRLIGDARSLPTRVDGYQLYLFQPKRASSASGSGTRSRSGLIRSRRRIQFCLPRRTRTGLAESGRQCLALP